MLYYVVHKNAHGGVIFQESFFTLAKAKEAMVNMVSIVEVGDTLSLQDEADDNIMPMGPIGRYEDQWNEITAH